MVLQGRITPSFHCKSSDVYYKSTIWAFSPNCIHGWSGEKNMPSNILVFHFLDVAEELQYLLGQNGFGMLSLDREKTDQLILLYNDLEQDYLKTGPLSRLRIHSAADRLSLIVCAAYSEQLKIRGDDYGLSIVDKAMALFSSHMHTGMGTKDTAEEIGVSASHLRRLFQKYKESSPREAFNELRMKRALELMHSTAYSFLEIANECGFTSQSAFNRAFLRYWKKTPSKAQLVPFEPG